MENKIHFKNIQVAILEAYYTWHQNDNKTQKIFKDFINYGKADENFIAEFKSFTARFRVARGIRNSNKNDFIHKEVRNVFNRLLNDISGDLVDDIAQKICELEYTYGNQVSLVSKFAMIINPEKYFPIDKHAENSIKVFAKKNNLESSISDSKLERYKVYLEIIELYKKNFLSNLGNDFISVILSSMKLIKENYLNIFSKLETIKPNSIDYEILINRTIDKYLMIDGGDENHSKFKLEKLSIYNLVNF